MNESKTMEQTSPRSRARIAGAIYLITFVTGGFALFIGGSLGTAAGLVAGVSYVAVTLFFYFIFKPVNKIVSLLAAAISLVGCANGPLRLLHVVPFDVHSLVFFGFYCLLIGYLIFRSTFLPKFLGVFMAISGLGWLTFLSSSLANSLSPYVYAPGIFGEGVLTLWLVFVGVNEEKWRKQSGLES